MKISNDIRFLGYIVDSGQLADGAMMSYFVKAANHMINHE